MTQYFSGAVLPLAPAPELSASLVIDGLLLGLLRLITAGCGPPS
jgi:hypothetical protein